MVADVTGIGREETGRIQGTAATIIDRGQE